MSQSELQQLRNDIESNGRRLDNLQSEFNANLLRKEPPITKPKQGNPVDPDEILAEELFQASNRRTVKSNREDVRDTDDPDEKLAQQIFDISGTDPEDTTEKLSPEDEALVEELFAASGGTRMKNNPAGPPMA